MYARIIARDNYSRLLTRLGQIPLPLLSTSVLDRDFVLSLDDTGTQCAFLRTDGQPFLPVLLGRTKAVQSDTAGGAWLELSLPMHSLHEMDVFYWNQMASLSSVIPSRERLTPSTVYLEDSILWSSPPLSFNEEVGTIYVHLPSSVIFAAASLLLHYRLSNLPLLLLPVLPLTLPLPLTLGSIRRLRQSM
ncbi:hypothetical protein C8R43DRAFT_1125650 [Mycena crocata]|nr:hypothetical protein C8R43DRAFT_1125650 [Mycena crocata]